MSLLDVSIDPSVPFSRGSPLWVKHSASMVMTVLGIMFISLLWRKFNLIPDPGLILLLTVALTTYITGGMPGMLSSAIVLFGSFIIFSHPLYLFRYNELDWRQVMAIAVACPMIALMVGSLKDQVDKLEMVTTENEKLQQEIRRFEGLKEAYHLCEQRFEVIAENVQEYGVFMLDLHGVVVKWNTGAERLFGYAGKEIIGENFSRFFSREDVYSKVPEHLLGQTRFAGRVDKTDWNVRKDGKQMRVRIMGNE
ncbi:MAG: PAS domain S-box protein, partial [Burkholderiales bacterium]|nr:PAS domain S-box protein [Burkholderiales bacterium]